MTLRRKVDKLLLKAKTLTTQRQQDEQRFRCKGRTSAEVVGELLKAIAEDDCGLVEELVDQVEQYDELNPNSDFGHGFLEWLRYVEMGWASLPSQIPRPWLEAWVNGFRESVRSGGIGSPTMRWRCEDCWMVMPTWTPDAMQFGALWTECPVCQSTRMQVRMYHKGGAFMSFKR